MIVPDTADLPFDATLDDLEAVVASGIGAFIEVGLALAEIRDRRLYLSTHETFDGYCRERWGMERTYAHRNIEAAQVASLLPIGNRPANESQARELARLDPEEVVEAWTAVVEQTGNRPTAATVRKVVDQALGNVAFAPVLAPAAPIDDEDDEPIDAELVDLVAGMDEIITDDQHDEPEHTPPARTTTTGIDGRTYQRTPTPAKRRRSSLVDAAQKAGPDLQKSVERVERIVGDDRFSDNRESVTLKLRSHLKYAIATCQELLDEIDRTGS